MGWALLGTVLQILLLVCFLSFPGLLLVLLAKTQAKKRNLRLTVGRSLYFLFCPLLIGFGGVALGAAVGYIGGGLAYGWGEGSTVGCFIFAVIFGLAAYVPTMKTMGKWIIDGDTYLGPPEV